MIGAGAVWSKLGPGHNLAHDWATVVFDRFNLNKSRNQHGNTNKHLFRLDSLPKTPR